MRVKKPTSKRSTTRMREGIKKKAAAQNRKNRKAAKKDVTWRLKHKKDPGIPSSFPYKEQILVELEEARREESEKKAQLKLQRQQQKAEALARGEMDADSEEEESEGEGGLGALLESAQRAAREYNEESDGDEMEEDDDDEAVEIELVSDDDDDHHEVDKLRRAYDRIFKTVVDHADVVLYVLDARDPELTRLRRVEQAVLQHPGKRLILVLNKVDLVPAEVLAQWLNVLKSSFPTVPVKALPGSAGASAYNKNLLLTATASALLQALKSFANKANLKRLLIVGVIGYPNVGKLSVINALTARHGSRGAACPVGNQAGVTTAMREIKIDAKLKILDSPGIVFADEAAGGKRLKLQQEAKLALMLALPPKQIIDPLPAVQLLLRKLSHDDDMSAHLKQYYQLPPLPSSSVEEFTRQFLIYVARTRGRLGKGGVPNLELAALMVLNDWRDGRVLGWTLPRASRATSGATVVDEQSSAGPKSLLRGDKEPPRHEQTTVVAEWAKEFDLDALLGDNFGLE